MQLAVAVRIHADVGVVAGGNGVESERERLLQHRRELDLLVAAHARIRGAPGGVFGDKVVHHVGLEALAEVPHVERDAEQGGRAAGIHRVLDCAAAARAGAQSARGAAQREMHADHVVPGLDSARGGHGAIDAPTHRRKNPHGSRVRERSRAPPKGRSWGLSERH